MILQNSENHSLHQNPRGHAAIEQAVFRRFLGQLANPRQLSMTIIRIMVDYQPYDGRLYGHAA
jgi:hypothetical protein